VIIIAASGPSLTPEQAKLTESHKVLSVSNAFQLVPWAIAHYAADREWWDKYGHECHIRPAYTNSAKTADAHGIMMSPCHPIGANSGSHAMMLAYALGHRHMALIGFDFQHTGGQAHFFGDHPEGMRNAAGCSQWLSHLPEVLKRMPGAAIVNCSTETAIPDRLIPRKGLSEVLSGPEH